MSAAGRAAAAALLIGSLLGAGCSSDGETDRGDARSGGSLVVAEAAPPESADPALASTPQARRVAWLAYTPVLTYRRVEGADGTQLVPALSEELPVASEDGRTYTFTLRKGLRYSDGSPLRPGDFERSVQRALRLNPKALPLYSGVVGARAYARGDAGGIRGISADERTRTVTIELETPDRLFPYALASTWTAPVPGRTPVRDLSKAPPPGIGPYRVARVRRDGNVALVRRRGWHLPGVPAGLMEEIVTRTVPGRAARVEAAIDGRVDVVEGEPPLDMLPDVRSKYKARYEEHPTLRLLYVALDPRRAPFRDGEVRRAVSFALDAAVLDRLYDGFLDPSCNALPPLVSGYKALDPCPYGERNDNADLVEASRLVDDAQATGAVVRLDGSGDRRSRALTRYLAATLRKIGLKVRYVEGGDGAQARFAAISPAAPHPTYYLRMADDPVLRARTRLLEQEGDPGDTAQEWSDVDKDVVGRAYLAPYGVATVGVLASERIDTDNCVRYHPVLGVDYSSFCLR